METADVKDTMKDLRQVGRRDKHKTYPITPQDNRLVVKVTQAVKNSRKSGEDGL
jgi:hypothetical protein